MKFFCRTLLNVAIAVTAPLHNLPPHPQATVIYGVFFAENFRKDDNRYDLDIFKFVHSALKTLQKDQSARNLSSLFGYRYLSVFMSLIRAALKIINISAGLWTNYPYMHFAAQHGQKKVNFLSTSPYRTVPYCESKMIVKSNYERKLTAPSLEPYLKLKTFKYPSYFRLVNYAQVCSPKTESSDCSPATLMAGMSLRENSMLSLMWKRPRKWRGRPTRDSRPLMLHSRPGVRFSGRWYTAKFVPEK